MTLYTITATFNDTLRAPVVRVTRTLAVAKAIRGDLSCIDGVEAVYIGTAEISA